MSKSVNKVILIGNLGRDPELKYTPSGTAVANFSIATAESYKGKDGEWKENTEWHNIVAWKALAEYVGNYLTRGSKVYIEGKLKTRNWEGKDGKKVYKTEVQAFFIMSLDSKQNNESNNDDDYDSDELTDQDIAF